MFNVATHIQNTALHLQKQNSDPISLFIYDLDVLEQHIQSLKQCLPEKVSLYYAIKANSETEILNTLAPFIDGFEISSGGEIAKIQQCVIEKPFVFSGPGKLATDIQEALTSKVEFFHVESVHELRTIQQLAAKQNHIQDILLRVNPHLPEHLKTKLSMAGSATPFGIDESELAAVIRLAEDCENIRLCGFHVHAMSHQCSVDQHLELMQWYLKQWSVWKSYCKYSENIQHFNVGGGIGVNYLSDTQFDWASFCEQFNQMLTEHQSQNPSQHDHSPLLRFEIGRFISAFCGFYVIEVLDMKSSHGEKFLICRGGTHQFRLPAAQAHDHPVLHYPKVQNKKSSEAESYNIVGQLCTPKDVLSRNQSFADVQIGDLLYLPMAGAYGYNISHADFLCHPRPSQHFIRHKQLL